MSFCIQQFTLGLLKRQLSNACIAVFRLRVSLSMPHITRDISAVVIWIFSVSELHKCLLYGVQCTVKIAFYEDCFMWIILNKMFHINHPAVSSHDISHPPTYPVPYTECHWLSEMPYCLLFASDILHSCNYSSVERHHVSGFSVKQPVSFIVSTPQCRPHCCNAIR